MVVIWFESICLHFPLKLIYWTVVRHRVLLVRSWRELTSVRRRRDLTLIWRNWNVSLLSSQIQRSMIGKSNRNVLLIVITFAPLSRVYLVWNYLSIYLTDSLLRNWLLFVSFIGCIRKLVKWWESFIILIFPDCLLGTIIVLENSVIVIIWLCLLLVRLFIVFGLTGLFNMECDSSILIDFVVEDQRLNNLERIKYFVEISIIIDLTFFKTENGFIVRIV